jgi:hypothetical protein
MNCKIAIAFGSMSAPNHPSPPAHSKRAIRRDLAKLWLAQTFREMVVIGLTRADMTEITQTALKGWCDKPAALDYNERRSKDE